MALPRSANASPVDWIPSLQTPAWSPLGISEASPPFLNFPPLSLPFWSPYLVQIPHHLMFSLTSTVHSCILPTLFSVPRPNPFCGTCDHLAPAMATLAHPVFTCLIICSCVGRARARHDIPALAGIPGLTTTLWLLKHQWNPALKSLSLLCDLHHSLCWVFLISTMVIITERAPQGSREDYMRKYL